MEFIDYGITIPRGFIVLDTPTEILPLTTKHLSELYNLILHLEECNIILDNELLNTLMSNNIDEFRRVADRLYEFFEPVYGEFFRDSFAISSKLINEPITLEEHKLQMCMYYSTYNLGIVPDFLMSNIRDISINGKPIPKDMKIISVKSLKEFKLQVASIINLPVVMSDFQFEFIEEALYHNFLKDLLQEPIKIKENLFKIMKLLIDKDKDILDYNIIKTSKDLLRYIYLVSGEDFVELPLLNKYKLRTSHKRIVMKYLNSIPLESAINDMKPYKTYWKRIAVNIIPGKSNYNKYAQTQYLFKILQNNVKVDTFEVITQRLIKQNNMIELIKHLSKKPGLLMRSLDMIIRKSNDINDIIYLNSTLREIKLNAALVLQIKVWLKYRSKNEIKDRVFLIKGNVKRISDKPLPKLNEIYINIIYMNLDHILVNHFKGKLLGVEDEE